jgi:CRISPR-associated endonuclease/helicase Cas3
MAEQFADEFGVGEIAKIAGLLHDLGKYSGKFQARLYGAKESVDHAVAGAVEIRNGRNKSEKPVADLISYAIAGHHGGLPDFNRLQERLGERELDPLDIVWRQEVPLPEDQLALRNFKKAGNPEFQISFLGKMIFSCLVDADFKDTERFYAANEGRELDRDWPDLRDNIDDMIRRFDCFMEDKHKTAPKNDLNTLRREILDHLCEKAGEAPGLFTLTVPTGGGKTLASLGFALKHAKAHNLRRIIYAIPFTSIIEQNAEVFRDVLGDDYILEHHSSVEGEKIWEQRDKLRLAMEDWAAPVVVTTNVQFFESLFANKTSRCRKLHNIAGSVIILDEAQSLPLPLLRPCLAAIDELARNYNVSIVLCTATQPALDKRDFGDFGLALEGRELAPDPTVLAQKLRRTKIILKDTEISDDELVCVLRENEQILLIVNSRSHALDLYRKAKNEGIFGLIHLSTRQYAVHRREILKQVKQTLKDGQPCRLIATSLVEAGVDIDFPCVWRAETGLDQIAQAAGRCNREGKRTLDESGVTVFTSKEHAPPMEIKQLAQAFSRTALKCDDLLSPEAIREYFREVYWQKGMEQLDSKKILEEFTFDKFKSELMFNYKKVAALFRMIESPLLPVIINDNDCVAQIIGRLKSPNVSAGKAARELQPYIVQIPQKAFTALMNNGRIKYHCHDLWGEQFTVLTSPELYSKETGLIWEDADVLENTIY